MYPSAYVSAVRTVSATLVAIISLSCFDSLAQENPDPLFSEQLDKFVTRLMEWDVVPGAAIVVVNDDETIFNGSFGMADAEAVRPVTPDTVFYIASSTKSFTALAAAICHERGELDLDESLDEVLNDADFHTDIDASTITIRQLLTHTHGIDNNGPVSFRSAYSGQHTPQLLKQLLRYHGKDPNGRGFHYGNIGYNIAGLAIENKLGLSWKELVQREIFEPLNMESTTGYVSTISNDRLAMPYSMEGTGFSKLHYAKSDDNMHAAGGLVTTANDLATWLKANINYGMVDGQQVIPKGPCIAAQTPHVKQDNAFMSFRRTGYGLGWNTGKYEDDDSVHHFGGFSGFHCHISFMPKQKIGVAVLVNAGSGGMFADVVARYAYDSLLEKHDFQERFSETEMTSLQSQLASARQRIQADRDRRAARSQELSHALGAYCGTYENDQFGKVTFYLADEKLESKMGPLWSRVEVFDGQNNALRVELTGSGQVVVFAFGEGELAESFTYSGFVFHRVVE